MLGIISTKVEKFEPLSGYTDLDLKADYLEYHAGVGTTIPVLVNAASGGLTAQDLVIKILGSLFEPVPKVDLAQSRVVDRPARIASTPLGSQRSRVNAKWPSWGQPEISVERIRQGMADLQSIGLTVFRPYFLMHLAVADRQKGCPEAGVDRLTEALADVHTRGERWWEAELHRLQGDLLLRQTEPNIDRAKACFHQALDVACAQGTKSLECRAAVSLARLRQTCGRGKRQDAYDLLAPVYDWFTELQQMRDSRTNRYRSHTPPSIRQPIDMERQALDSKHLDRFPRVDGFAAHRHGIP